MLIVKDMLIVKLNSKKVVDVYIIKRRNNWGKLFGFARYGGVESGGCVYRKKKKQLGKAIWVRKIWRSGG